MCALAGRRSRPRDGRRSRRRFDRSPCTLSSCGYGDSEAGCSWRRMLGRTSSFLLRPALPALSAARPRPCALAPIATPLGGRAPRVRRSPPLRSMSGTTEQEHTLFAKSNFSKSGTLPSEWSSGLSHPLLRLTPSRPHLVQAHPGCTTAHDPTTRSKQSTGSSHLSRISSSRARTSSNSALGQASSPEDSSRARQRLTMRDE